MTGCQHNHLRFEDGAFRLTCVDCGQAWGALVKNTLAFNFLLKAATVNPGRETRHDRFEAPRDKPLK